MIFRWIWVPLHPFRRPSGCPEWKIPLCSTATSNRLLIPWRRLPSPRPWSSRNGRKRRPSAFRPVAARWATNDRPIRATSSKSVNPCPIRSQRYRRRTWPDWPIWWPEHSAEAAAASRPSSSKKIRNFKLSWRPSSSPTPPNSARRLSLRPQNPTDPWPCTSTWTSRHQCRHLAPRNRNRPAKWSRGLDPNRAPIPTEKPTPRPQRHLQRPLQVQRHLQRPQRHLRRLQRPQRHPAPQRPRLRRRRRRRRRRKCPLRSPGRNRWTFCSS